MPLARAFAALLILTIVGACGGRPSAQAPTSTAAPVTVAPLLTPPPATPTAAPATPSATAAPASQAAPTVTPAPTNSLAGPTPAPPAEGPLPAPLYIIDSASGQVVRVARDGRAATQVTFEAAPVLELVVASGTGTLAYIVGEPESRERTLVLLDGGGRRERLYANISGVAVSPDGQRVVYRLDSPEPGLIIGQEESPSGIWASLPSGPGRPALQLADEPADGDYDPDAPAWVFAPVGFSPDGARLAVFGYDADGPAIPGGELVILGPGPSDVTRGPTCCEMPAWSRDGAVLHSAGGGPGPDLRYGLFRLDAATGAETPVLEQAPDGAVPLVVAPQQFADGQLYAFVELASADGFSWDHPFRPRLARVEGDGAVTPLSEPVPWPSAVLWADDATGAVIAVFTTDSAMGAPLWIPADGSPTTTLAADGLPVAWAPRAPLAAGSCVIFEPISYQEPAARQLSANARDVQARLAALGFDPGAADGFYGDQTRAAVQAFQRDRGLPDSGDVDCATWQTMLGAP